MSDDTLRYPLGKFTGNGPNSPEQRAEMIRDIGALPPKIAVAVHGLNDTQLDTPYRDGGWTVRQVVHHVADSHMNAYIRFKLAMTEDSPTIKPYQEALWAELVDGRSLSPAVSLTLLAALHQRWILLLQSLTESDFRDRGYMHPETGRRYSLDIALALYAWHGKHHVAHITSLRQRMGWT